MFVWNCYGSNTLWSTELIYFMAQTLSIVFSEYTNQNFLMNSFQFLKLTISLRTVSLKAWLDLLIRDADGSQLVLGFQTSTHINKQLMLVADMDAPLEDSDFPITWE